MAGFAKDVVQKIKIPEIEAPDFSENRTTTEDVADIAAFGFSFLERNKLKEQKQRQLTRSNEMGKAVLDIAKLKSETAAQGLSSMQFEAMLQKKLSGFSALEQIGIREQAAKDAFGGSQVKRLEESEHQRQVRVDKQWDDDANNLGFALATDENKPQIQTWRMEQSKLKAEQDQLNIEIKRLELTGKKIDTEATLAKRQADIITGGISSNAQGGLNAQLFNIRTLVQSGDIQESEVGEMISGVIQQGILDINAQLPILTKQLPPLVAQKVTQEMDAIIVRYQSHADALISAAGSETWTKLLTKNTENLRADSLNRIVSSPETALLDSLVQARFLDAQTLQQFTKVLIPSLSADAGKAIEQWRRGGLPKSDAGVSFLNSLLPQIPKGEESSVVDLITPPIKDTYMDILKGEIGSEKDLSYFINQSSDLMQETISSPKKGQLSEGAVRFVIDPINRKDWDKVQPQDKELISSKIGAYTSRFFGSNNSGSFVPGVKDMYKSSIPKTVRDAAASFKIKLFTLSMDERTGNFKVIINDKAVESALQKESGFLGNFMPDQELRTSTMAGLRSIKRRIETGTPLLNDILSATAKSSEVQKDIVTQGILNILSGETDLEEIPYDVDKRFIISPPPPEPVTVEVKLPPLADVSDLDDDEFEEMVNLMREERAKSSTTS